jgi:cob(I)alamin adenosyltransferase
MSARPRDTSRARVILLTGEGKGKTTSAMGQVLRLVGHGKRVLVVQFAKGDWPSGEREALKLLGDRVTLLVTGGGWLDLNAEPRRPEEVARIGAAWREALNLLNAGDFDAVVLDELAFVVGAGFLDADEVTAFLTRRPADLAVVITGRGAPPKLIAAADIVTEMRCVKHDFDAGRSAAEGIEY